MKNLIEGVKINMFSAEEQENELDLNVLSGILTVPPFSPLFSSHDWNNAADGQTEKEKDDGSKKEESSYGSINRSEHLSW